MAGNVIECANCGASVNAEAIACPGCGGDPHVRDPEVLARLAADAPQAAAIAAAERRSAPIASTAGLACVLLGLVLPFAATLGLILCLIGLVQALVQKRPYWAALAGLGIYVVALLLSLAAVLA